MGLADDCQKLFNSSDRSKGQSYFRSGQVQNVEIEGCTAYATVQGSYDYEVTIDWSDPFLEALGVGCACPRFAEVGACKHLWAVVLELDRRGVSSPGRFTDTLRDVADLQEDEDSYFEEEWIPYDKVTKRAKKKQASPRTWKRELADLMPSETSSIRYGLRETLPGNRQILYAIDLTSSHNLGTLVLQLLQQERKRNGEFGKPTKLNLTPNLVQEYGNTSEHAALEWLLATAQRLNNFGYYSPYQAYSDFTLPTVAMDEVLPRLAATGHLYWGIDPVPPIQPEDLHAITWDNDTRWRLAIKIIADDAQQQWKLQGRLVHAGDPAGQPLSQAVLATEQGVVVWPDRAARLDAAGQGNWIELLRRTESLSIPYADRAAFLPQLLSLPQSPEITWPANLQLPRTAAKPRGHLAIRTSQQQARLPADLNVTVSFQYDDLRVRWNDPRDLLYCAEPERIVMRDRQQEQTLFHLLQQFPLRPVSRYSQIDHDGELPARQLSELVARLPQDAWTVEAEGHALRQPGEFHFSVTSGIDWFELAGEIQFDDQTIALPELLAAVRSGERFIRLGDGSQGILPDEWLKRYGVLVDLAQVADGKVRFKPTQTLLLDALLAEQRHLKVDRKFSDYRQKLQNFAGVASAEPPRGFTGALRPYQRTGLGWLRFLQDFQFGGCLADDMGLGKTVQVLALLEQRRARRLRKNEERLPSLVVVPRSLMFNWQAEAARFAPKLRVLNFSQPNRQGIWDQIAQHDLVLTTYGTLLRDIIKLKDQRFDYAILDEAQAIKNANSQSAKAARLLQAQHRLALSGTPIENHLGELWSLVEFLNPGMLGKFSAFSELANGSTQSVSDRIHGRNLISKLIQPIMLRRTKQQVLPDLPEKTEQTLYCDLSTAERKKYNELRDYYRASLTQRIEQDGLEKSKIHVLEALLRLRQSACHQGLLDNQKNGQTSAKLEALLEHLEELVSEGHKALVFSQFTQLLDIVRPKLAERRIVFEYLDGKTRDRQKRVERFQSDPHCPVFLISLKAGGRGLNLTAADYVFILDPWWNPAVEAQAVDRAHRLGQQNKVFAYRLIARDTVEEKILELQQSKRELADSIITADASVLRNLTAEDLRLLLT